MRIRSLTGALTTAAVAATLAVVSAPGAEAAGSVHIVKIYYDSPGSDTRTNKSLNGEWVAITNSTSKSVRLEGWTLTDASRHTYTFEAYTLRAGRTVKVRTGSGDDTVATKYQGRRAYVWNNDKDTATLRRASGSKADSCSYNSTAKDYKIC